MYHLDIKDKKILYQLDFNARQSFSQIGRKVNLPKTVVNYRVKKLIDSEIIKNFYTIINPFKLGFSGYRIYINFQYTTPRIIDEICQYFKEYPLNWWTISVEGRYDLVVIIWVNYVNKFYTYWEKTLQRYRDFFREQQFSVYIQSYSFLNEYLLDNQHPVQNKRKSFILSGEKKVNTIDQLDLKILKKLANNARLSLREIATSLNLPYTLIKKRFNKLILEGIIQGFRADIDIFKIGYQYYKADIFLKNYEDRSKIIKYVLNNPNLIRIDKSVGVSDLELEFLVKNNNDFQLIMKNLITRFHNSIKNYKYLSASKIHNMNYIPNDV